MLLQIKSKKGVSLMVGYVLLITFAIIMGGIIYQSLKTYVPKEALECPDSTSFYIKDYSCEGTGPVQLTLTLKNNGNFAIGGYFIHASENEDEELATIDLSGFFDENAEDGGIIVKNSIVFEAENENKMNPGDEKTSVFNIEGISIDSIEIIPIRFQEEENKIKFVSCGNAKIKEKIICS